MNARPLNIYVMKSVCNEMFSAARLSLLVVLLFHDQFVSSANIGRFDILVHHVEECADIGTGEMRVAARIKKYNRTLTVGDVNITLQLPYDDRMSVELSMAQLTNNGYKTNFFSKKFDKACSFALTYGAGFMKDLLKGMKLKSCPVPKGSYFIKDFAPSKDPAGKIAFFYNRYKAVITNFRGTRKIGCMVIILDLLPKKKH